jgi:hypothetical protein
MIIEMNATVCGDMTMVSKRRFMIAGSDWGRRVQRGGKRGTDQERKKFQIRCRKRSFVAVLMADKSASAAGAHGLRVAESGIRSASSRPECHG